MYNPTHQKRVEEFLGEMLGKNDIILYEGDFSLHDTNGNGIMYYPQCFEKVLKTNAVKRLARIFQLGTKVYTHSNAYHTRLEHSKGTYYRTLELLLNLYEQENIRQLIKDKGLQKYMVATLMRALLHDVGHGPFSHTMETVCNLPKGFHEEIGFRLIEEDTELRGALEEIHPELPALIKEVREKNFLGLNRIFEGQSDVDRGDFGPRDSLFDYKLFEKISIAVSQMFGDVTIESVKDKKSNDEPKIIPVFGAKQIGNLDTFFTARFNNYKEIYYDPKAISYDYVFKAFAEALLKSKESYRLKDFLSHNMGIKSAKEVDLSEYIEFDDVEYLKGIFEVMDNDKEDPTLRKLAQMLVPPKEKIEDFYYGLMV